MATSPINPNEISWDSGPPPQQSQHAAIDPQSVSWDGPAVTDQPQGLTKEQQQQVLRYIPKAKSPEDLDRFARQLTQNRVGINNAKEILTDYARTKRKVYGFSEDPFADDKAPDQPATAGDYIKGIAENAGRGLMHGLGFIDDTVNPLAAAKDLGSDVKGIYDTFTGHATQGDLKRAADKSGPGFFEKNAGAAYDQSVGVRPAKNALQRYTNNVSQFVGGSLIPMGEFNGARGLAALTTGAVTGGVANQAAQDAFPDSPLIQQLAGLVGAHVGATPLALKPARENAMVNVTADKNPQAPLLPEAAQGLTDLAASKTQGGLVPKGRAKLTVPEINDVGEKYLHGLSANLTKLVRTGQLDPERAAALNRALTNKDGIRWDEIDALKGDTAGDAVAGALSHYKSVRALTEPGGGRFTLGAIGTKAWNLTAGQIPYLGELIKIKPTDADAARIRASDKAIERNPLFQRLQKKVGPSTVGPAMDAFNQRISDTYAAERQARQDAADQKARADFASSLRKAQADSDKAAKDAKKAAKSGLTDEQDAKVRTRETAALDAIQSPPVLPKRPASVQKALDKYTKAASGSTERLAQFDTDLNTPPPEPKAPKPAKESAHDKYVRANIEGGVQGNYNSYADTLGVKREDVLRALKTIKTDDIAPFEIDKLVHGYKLSPAGRAGLIPRLQKVLTEDGTVAARAKEAEAPAKAPKTVAKAPEKAPPTATADSDSPAPTPPPAEDTGGNYRDIRRPKQHAEGKARLQAAFDKARGELSAPDSPHSQEIVAAAKDGLDHIKEGEKTTESAMRYFDNQLGPKLRSKGFLPEEIEDLRKDVENAATVGKPYRTDTEFEKGAKTGKRGRPRRPEQTTFDDVPF
jgi:hypothetical protein